MLTNRLKVAVLVGVLLVSLGDVGFARQRQSTGLYSLVELALGFVDGLTSRSYARITCDIDTVGDIEQDGKLYFLATNGRWGRFERTIWTDMVRPNVEWWFEQVEGSHHRLDMEWTEDHRIVREKIDLYYEDHGEGTCAYQYGNLVARGSLTTDIQL